MRHIFRTVGTAFVILLLASRAPAQTSQGAIVSGSIGVTAAENQTSLSFSGSGGYRFNRGIALTIELASVPSIESEVSTRLDLPLLREVSPLLGFGDLGIDDEGDSGSLTTFTANLRLEMPTTARRILPYAVIGGGVANVKERFRIIYSYPPSLAAFTAIALPIAPIVQNFRESSTDMALTLGGGVSILQGNHLSYDIDLRYLHLIGYEDRDIGRFGAGVSYRF